MDLFLTPEQSDMFVIGLPLKTDYGTIKPIKVKEYPSIEGGIGVLKMADWEVRSTLKKRIKDNPIAKEMVDDLQKLPMYQCVQNNIMGLRDTFNNIFSKFIIDYDQSKFLFKFKSQQDFDDFRMLILDYNGIDYIVWEKNPELRYFQKLKLYYNNATGKTVNFDSMFTSLVATGHKPHDINDFTLNQFYSSFKRLQFFKAHDTTTLYKTVDSKNKIDVVEWFAPSKESTADKGDKTIDEIVSDNKHFSNGIDITNKL